MRESTIKDILTGYERKRDLAETELEARKKKCIFTEFLKLKKLMMKYAKIGLKLAKLVLLNPQDKDKILEETKIKMDALKNRKNQLLNDFKVPAGYLNLKYDCPYM